MKKIFSKTIQRFADTALEFSLAEGLLQPPNGVCVAVSGGQDSVALLRWLVWCAKKNPFPIHVLHFDHRVQSANRDFSRFVGYLAAELNLPFHLGRFNVLKVEQDPGFHPKLKGQALYRLARYQFLKHKTVELGLDTLVFGHQADDQVETVLWRLLRGCSPSGLRGIRPLNRLRLDSEKSIRVVRPFLKTSRETLTRFLEEIGQTFVEDPSNTTGVYLRNRIRHELLPTLRQDYNPQIDAHILHLAESKRREDALLEALVRQFMRRHLNASHAEVQRFHKSALASCPQGLRLRLIEKILRKTCGGPQTQIKFEHLIQINDLLQRGGPGIVALAGGWSARFSTKADGEWLYIEPVSHHSQPKK